MRLLMAKEVVLAIESAKIKDQSRSRDQRSKINSPFGAVGAGVRSQSRVDELVLLKQELVSEPLETVDMRTDEGLVFCKFVLSYSIDSVMYRLYLSITSCV